MSKVSIESNIDDIEGLCLVQPTIFKDKRGYFFESYNEREFLENHLNHKFVQDNIVYSKAGVLRGMHVNISHPQGKLVYVLKGRIFDVVVDLRKNSKTYKKFYSIELSEDNKTMLYIPEGMGHGYYVMNDSLIQFKVTTHYIPNDEVGFSWNSGFLNIQWPFGNSKPVLNDKDANSVDFDDIKIKW